MGGIVYKQSIDIQNKEMTETRTSEDQIFLWKWDTEQIKAAINKNKTIQKIRKDLLKSRSKKSFQEKQKQRRIK